MRITANDIASHTEKTAAAHRYHLAQQLKPLSLADRRAYITKMVENGTARIERQGNHKVACTILGRTASSTMLHVEWAPAVAVKNWIKATLEKDAPEEEK